MSGEEKIRLVMVGLLGLLWGILLAQSILREAE